MNGELREWVAEVNDEALLCDGFDDCLIGYVEVFGRPPLALYDKTKMLKLLKKNGLTFEEALEHFEYNILGAWCGENTPAFMTRAPRGKR